MTRDPEAARLIDTFIKNASPDVIDLVREDAARCCEETARWERGERGPLRTPDNTSNPLLAEFSDDAFGVAAEVVMAVHESMKRIGRSTVDLQWTIAARLLRAGWKRGDRLSPHVMRKGDES